MRLCLCMALTYVLFQPLYRRALVLHSLCVRMDVFMCRCNTNVIRYGCRCRCVLLFLFRVVWSGAVSVRMQSIPFCERGNRNSVVVISTSSSSLFTFSSVSSLSLLFPAQRFLLVSLWVAVVFFFVVVIVIVAASCSKDFEWFENCLLFFTVHAYACRQPCFHFGFFLLARPWGVFWFLNKPYQALNTINDYIFFPYCVSVRMSVAWFFFARLHSLHFSFNTDGKFMGCV